MATTQKIKSTLNQWATLETPPSKFEKFVPEKLKGQWGIFPFAYPRIGEPVNSNFLKALGAEFIGSMMFMFILVSQIVFSCYIGEGAEANKVGASTCLLNPVRVLPIATTAGFSMFVLIYATASFSGGEEVFFFFHPINFFSSFSRVVVLAPAPVFSWGRFYFSLFLP